jgi:hypothetical protein
VLLRKVPRVAGHEVVRRGGFCAFQEPVVGFVDGDRNGLCCLYEVRDLSDGSQCRLDVPWLQLQAGSAQHFFVLGEHGRRDIECDVSPKSEQ